MRLRPYTMVLPKPLIPVLDRPILEHILLGLASDGVQRVDLCLGRHLGGLIQAYLSQTTTLPPELELVYHWEDEPLGTVGPLRQITDLDTPFIVMNGDILTTLDYGELYRTHLESGAGITIAMHQKTVDISLGVLQCDEGKITGYREKPRLTYDVSMGIYAFSPRAVAAIPETGPCQFPDLVVRLLEAGEVVHPYRSGALWYDIGTFAEYERVTADLRERPELLSRNGHGSTAPRVSVWDPPAPRVQRAGRPAPQAYPLAEMTETNNVPPQS